MVATQVYGDVFVLLLLGTVTGMLLAMPVLAEREAGLSRALMRPAGRARRVVLQVARPPIGSRTLARSAQRRGDRV